MPEKINEYLALVCRQIRWKRALPDLRRELGTHLLEQRDACIEAGMTEDEAEAEDGEETFACPKCGYPLKVGMTECPNCHVGISFEEVEEENEE